LRILVAFASKHRSTAGIARFIGEKLRSHGFEVDILDVKDVPNLGIYNAFVVGSAVYMGHWMKEAKEFLSKNKVELSAKPLWLFSSGPTGKDRKNAKGQDLQDPKVSGPIELDKIEQGLIVKEHRIFFGAFDPRNLDLFSRQFFKSAYIRNATPIGDFRDWKEIEEWANNIAHGLEETPKSTTVS
jgi:menaquinone-dependent protoporphyrinogen oxidase